MKKSDPQRRRKLPAEGIQRLYWLLGGLFLTIIFVVVIVIGDYGLYQIYQLHREEKGLNKHIAEMRIEQDSLYAEVARLESDIKHIEKLAREKYRMAEPGEKVFRVIERNP